MVDLQVPLLWLFSLHLFLYMLQSIYIDMLVPSLSLWNEMMCSYSMLKQWSACSSLWISVSGLLGPSDDGHFQHFLSES